MSESKWIKVTPETLPKMDERVLVVEHIGEEKAIYVASWTSDGSYPDSDENEYRRSAFLDFFTHWQSLPELPREGE